ncbi:Tetracycline resistance protein [Sulfitobacter noctilucicola]|uniref:DHA1 family tetracycline resistance protein-like MFS transporter n=1 Tax=Sulfitobacter noctilucicola TaxID=1342301 RepID=A0A7W6M7L9_9RHOB|nr:tetracycline resistance MFS efflux pump [Sulfitobacter noctilucicola]KIN61925.1 Tetracycline resistance protein [Sulfitobacter noctilucicola]MBB4173553.1 DHA1 family tetracycline resistance protein-like MFS transporter [Sulfitobacter noctilucicola]
MRPAVLFIMLTVMIDAMGIGLMVPVMPDLIREVNGGGLSDAALWGGVLATSFAVMQFLFGPVLGGLSDRFGRRPVLLTSLVVMGADYIVMALAGSIWLLLAGRIVGGITAATQATASAYMADISTPAERTKNFGLVGASFGMGFVLGPIMGGFLAEYGTRAPFWAAACLAFANVALGWMVLKETLDPASARPFDWRRANPFGAVRHLGALPGVRRLLTIYFLYFVAFSVYPSVWAYFGQERFDWSPSVIGMSLALFGATMALVQAGIIRLAINRFGERGTVFAGLLFAISTYVSIAFITSGTITLILTPLAALAGVIPPALQGIMSQRVADNAQGELQGALTSASSLAMILSPLVMTASFAQFTSPTAPVYFPGAPFAIAAALMVVALVVFVSKRPLARRRVT